jgi:hypothetical protein
MGQLPNHLKIFPVISYLFYSFIFSSCIKEEINLDHISDSVNWNIDYDAPLAYGSLSLKDIIHAVDNQGYIKEDNNGLLYLVYRNNAFSQSAGNLLPIPSQHYSQVFTSVDADFPSWTGQDSVKFSRSTYFDFSVSRTDAEIDSMYFKMGLLSLDTSINYPYPCRITITFPTLTRNGKPYSYTVNKTDNSTNYSNKNTLPIILSGYKASFTSVAGVPNKIPATYNVVVKNSKGSISSSNSISMDADIQMATFSSIFGYLGQINDLMDETDQKITLDFFDNSMSNYNIEFEKSELTAYIHNSFGVPVQLQLGNTRTYSEKTSTYFPITFSPSTINPEYPRANQVGSTIHDTIHIQSNITSAIPTSPHYFYYDALAIANPLGKTGNPNFFTDTSKINIDLELTLPLKFKAGNLEVIDTMSFDLGSTFSDFSIIKRMVLFNTFTNSIPFDLKVQVFLANDKKIIFDSLYSSQNQPIIKSGVFNNATGKYTFSSPNTLSTSFDSTRAKKLENAKYAFIRVSITTAENGQKIVGFYSDYRLNVSFKAQAELNVTSLNQL